MVAWDSLPYRKVVTDHDRSYQETFIGTPFGPPGIHRFTTVEEIWTKGNPGWGRLKSSGDIGGPFLLKRLGYSDTCQEIPGTPSAWSANPGYVFPEYSGRSAELQRSTWPADPSSSLGLFELDMIGKGATAISRCAPTKPAFDGAVALGELVREGFPRLAVSTLKHDVKKYRALGSDYLNVEFGWKPFVSDLRKFAHSVQTSDDYIQQLARNSGKDVRRRYKFPVVSSESEKLERSNWPGAASSWQMVSGTGNLYSRVSSVEKTWFSGAFTYHFDLSGSSSWERVSNAATRFRHLYGIKLTPDVLWNLMPWSWALDWVGNIGDVMSNIALFSNDGLVMRYGYVMSTLRNDITYQLRDVTLAGGTPYSADQTFTSEVKARLRATPFGFGLSFDGFTPRQLAIIAALGMSRGPR
jgi:hypothetical protein